MSEPLPTIVLGATGYVAGELLRLIAVHPSLELAAAVSASAAGSSIDAVFPHLRGQFGDHRFLPRDSLAATVRELERVAVFSAAPHGASAAMVDEVLEFGEVVGTSMRVVDLSADFRYATEDAYRAVYEQEHGAVKRLEAFSCGLPEHFPTPSSGHVGHPGCFCTAALLVAVPMLELGLSAGDIYLSGVTGSTGSGKLPSATTHHPFRQSNLFAYKPLHHRHQPEMEAIIRAATGMDAQLHFVPHSGPFARGIHMTAQGRLAPDTGGHQVVERLAAFYDSAPFVTVVDQPPRLKDVVGSNQARIAVSTRGDHFAVMIVIDNLVKGAAGGAVQWMNRLWGLPETAGLTTPALGWT